jgi:hypothetical protein
MQSKKFWLALVLSLVLMLGISMSVAAETNWRDPYVLAEDLDGSTGAGSAIGPGRALYVTEAAAGRISRVDPRTGEVTTFASGLPLGNPEVGIGGAMDVAFIGETAYALVTLVGPQAGGSDTVGIYRVDGPNSFTVIADIGAFSSQNPPKTEYALDNGVQYALETFRGGFLVTDGHHNRVLHVTLDGEVSELIAFGNTVPTGLEVSGNTIYMGEAGPTPHDPEDGKILTFKPNSLAPIETIEKAAGAQLLVDVEFGRGRTLYGLSQGVWDGEGPGSPAKPDTGALMEVNREGEFTLVMGGLNLPSSFEFIGNSAYIVTLAGEVWVIDNVSDPPFGKSRSR